MPDRSTRTALVIAVGLCLCCCQLSSSRRASSRAERQLAANDYAGAAAGFDRAVTLATDPVEKAQAYLGLGRTQLRRGEYRAAQKALYAARDQLLKARSSQHRDRGGSRLEIEALDTEISRAIGLAYLDAGQLELSRRYLLKAVSRLTGAERDVTLAYLACLSGQLGDAAAQARYRTELKTPYSLEVAQILSARSPRLVTALERARAASTQARRRVASPASSRSAARRHKAPQTPPQRRRSLTVNVFARHEWGARRARKSKIKPMGNVTRITIHHSAGDSFWAHSRSATASHIRSIQRYHQDKNDWADIGYHYIVDRTGSIWEGRDQRYQGAHAGGTANRGNIGIVVLGNYTRQGLRSEQARALGNLVGQLSDRYGVPHYRVHTHDELRDGHTDCPGPPLTRLVEQIRRKLYERHLALGK